MSMSQDTLDIIPVKADEIPCTFMIRLAGRTFEFTFKYNDAGGMYTVDLAIPGPNRETLCHGVPIRYATPLFEFWSDERYPWPVITPLCLTGEHVTEITRDNFGREVLLYALPRR